VISIPIKQKEKMMSPIMASISRKSSNKRTKSYNNSANVLCWGIPHKIEAVFLLGLRGLLWVRIMGVTLLVNVAALTPTCSGYQSESM
jgi:hypothetical protein